MSDIIVFKMLWNPDTYIRIFQIEPHKIKEVYESIFLFDAFIACVYDIENKIARQQFWNSDQLSKNGNFFFLSPFDFANTITCIYDANRARKR